MAKPKVAFACGDCGAEHAKWQGQCTACGRWNSLREFIAPTAKREPLGYAGDAPRVAKLTAIEATESARIASGLDELDRVLGGGFVPGAVVLIGGDPGAGKSTLLLQVCATLAQGRHILYVSGEESLAQIASRARRLRVSADKLTVATETAVERVAELLQAEQFDLVVVDSIQVMHTETSDSAPGSVTQVRESAARLVRLAKQSGIACVLVGHVTKEGNLAGPKVLEHMIDCFLMLEAPPGSRYRTLRSQKNRFGAVNELGVFAMTDAGMKAVGNPSAIFLQRPDIKSPGSVVTVAWEGTRPLLVEIQALVDTLQGGYPKRVAVGLDAQRLAMHLAVLHRHCGVSLADQDVFANVVGGVRIARNRRRLGAPGGNAFEFSRPGAAARFGGFRRVGTNRRSAPGRQRPRPGCAKRRSTVSPTPSCRARIGRGRPFAASTRCRSRRCGRRWTPSPNCRTVKPTALAISHGVAAWTRGDLVSGDDNNGVYNRDHALSLLSGRRHPRHRFALGGERRADSPPPRVSNLRRTLYHLRERGTLDAARHQEQRWPRAVRRGQAAFRFDARARRKGRYRPRSWRRSSTTFSTTCGPPANANCRRAPSARR